MNDQLLLILNYFLIVRYDFLILIETWIHFVFIHILIFQVQIFLTHLRIPNVCIELAMQQSQILIYYFLIDNPRFGFIHAYAVLTFHLMTHFVGLIFDFHFQILPKFFLIRSSLQYELYLIMLFHNCCFLYYLFLIRNFLILIF